MWQFYIWPLVTQQKGSKQEWVRLRTVNKRVNNIYTRTFLWTTMKMFNSMWTHTCRIQRLSKLDSLPRKRHICCLYIQPFRAGVCVSIELQFGYLFCCWFLLFSFKIETFLFLSSSIFLFIAQSVNKYIFWASC